MNIQRMKLIDELFGPPICLIFNFYDALNRPFIKYKLDSAKVKNILLIKFFGMGSIILAGPMVRALKNKFPYAKIIIMTFSANEELCHRIDMINEVIAIETSSFIRFIISIMRAIVKIRNKHCEISIDLEFLSKSSTLIQYLCGTKLRVGYYLTQIGILLKMMWRGDLLTHKVHYNPHRHTKEAFLALARSLGAETADLKHSEIKIFEIDKQKVDRLFKESGITIGDFLIAININSSPLCIERRWPIENFSYLVRKLQEHKGTKIVLIGGKSDEDYVGHFFLSLDSKDNIINLSGKLDIGGLAALLSKANLLVTNDSGPLHLAVSLDTPVAAFFGPETPVRFGPGGEKHVVFYPDIYCSPCLNIYNQKIAPCNGDNRCMRMILPEYVYKTIKAKFLHAL